MDSLGAPESAEDLFDHLAIMKFLLNEFDQTKTYGQDDFAIKIAIFLVTT